MAIAHEVILPALRSCASCSDPAVRRTASNIFLTLIGYLASAVDFDSVKSTEITPSQSTIKHHNRQSSSFQGESV